MILFNHSFMILARHRLHLEDFDALRLEMLENSK
jgi:hypothetical protein